MPQIGSNGITLRNVASIRTKLLLAMIPVVVVALVVMSVIAITKVTSAQQQSVSQSVANGNAAQAEKFNGQVQARMSIAETEATLGSEMIGQTNRQAIMNIEHTIMVDNPELAGSYIDYLPNAFDGKDAKFKGQPGMGAQGEFGTYWNRLGGSLKLSFGMDGWQTASWFQIPAKTGKPSYIEPYLYDGALLASTVAPISHDGNVVGVAGIDMLLGDLTKQVNALKVLKTGYSFVVSHTGILVTYPSTKLVGKDTLDQLATSEHTPAFAAIAADVKAGRSGSLVTTDPLTGKQVKMFYTPVQSGQWGFISVAPTSEILAGAHSLRNTLIVIAVIIVLLVAAILAFVATKLVKPAERVRDAAQQISSTGDLDLVIDNDSADEIGQVADSFREIVSYMSDLARVADQIAAGHLDVAVEPRSPRDRLGIAITRMRAQIEELIRQIQSSATNVASSSTEMAATSKQLVETSEELVTTSETLVSTSDELVSTSGELVTTSDELVANSEAMAATSHQLVATSATMSANAVETGRAIGEIARAIEDIAHGAERQARSMDTARGLTEEMVSLADSSVDTARMAAELSSAAKAAADEGVGAVTRASQAMETVRTASVEAAEAIRELGVKSEQVGGIIATITGIAQQTNLLALNAAIEAVRAGEQGRGFAVVAEEVRKLAEESQAAAQSIADLITTIQSDTQKTITLVEGGADATAGGVETVVAAQAAFVKIGDSVADVTTRTDEIIAAIARVADAAQNVQVEISESAAAAEQASASTQQVSASTEQVSASAEEASASTQEVSASTELVSASAQQATSAARQISASAQQTSESAQRTSVSAQQTSASAQQTSASAQQIADSAEGLERVSEELAQLVAQFTLSGV
ncbi:MAG TPA: methyl-accepting chemotaxis protein [Solirubrobacteraceae bacterium]|nr:methyl-accepting chemotaxis protein [Solirubrobacteraceae bacterium]